jgi:hypothetical protein
MATKRDPWQPVGTFIYHIVLFLTKTTGFKVHGGTPVAREYESDPEPRWMFCLPCGFSTVHEPHFWVEDGETDFECSDCGAVTYG